LAVDILAFSTSIIFVMALGFYLITNLQWYDYKIERVVLKHHKPLWHFGLFIIPFILHFVLPQYFVAILPLYLVALGLWYYKLDKKLVFTWRVKRFLILLFVLTFFINMLSVMHKVSMPKKGDFYIDNKYTFEIGGRNKSFEQIKDISNSFLAIDDIETGIGNKIPLWLFGFLY